MQSSFVRRDEEENEKRERERGGGGGGVIVRGSWSLSLRRGLCLLCMHVGGGFSTDRGFCIVVSEVEVCGLDFLLVFVHAC